MNYLVSIRKGNRTFGYVFGTESEARKFANDIFKCSGLIVEISFTNKSVNRIYK